MVDEKNVRGKEYWSKTWSNLEATDAFEGHFGIIEEDKWRYITSVLPRNGGRSLEVGCGLGHVSSHLADIGFSAYMIDYSEDGIVKARESFTLYKNRRMKTYIVGDGMKLPFRDNSFDVVFSTGLIEHFEDPSKLIQEMCRVLRSGGIFFSDVCPGRFSLLTSMDFISMWRHGKPEGWFESKISRGEVETILKQNSIRLIESFHAGVLPPRVLSRIPVLRYTDRLFLHSLRNLWRLFDKTLIASLLGFYFFIGGQKE